MRPLILSLLAVSALALTGCGTQPTPTAGEPTKEPLDCVEVNAGVLAELQSHAQTDITFTRAAAIASANSDTWYLAATYTTTDLDGEAVFITTQNPATSDGAAFLSVDAMAAAVTDYHRIDGGTVTAPGAVDALTCLEQ